MPLAKELRRGSYVELDGQPCVIEQVVVQSPSARGANTLYKVRARNVLTRAKVDKTFRGTDMLRDIEVTRRPVQYLYRDATHLHFMDEESYEQFSFSAEELGEQLNYLVENMPGLSAVYLEGQPVGLQLPQTVDLKVLECDPGVRGDSATARTKPAKLQTGLVVQVPEYLEQGEVVRVDTTTGKFVCRA